MALTRKFLKALGIESDKLDEIIDAHVETVNGLKEERDRFKEQAESLPGIQKELDDLKRASNNKNDDSYKEKYDNLKKQFDDYKDAQTAKETTAKKTAAYKKLLEDAGVSSKRTGSILRVSKELIDGLELDDKGNVKDSENLTKNIKNEWADFITQEHKEGARTSTPPGGNGGTVRTLKDIYADKELAKDTTARQKAIAEAIEADPEAF